MPVLYISASDFESSLPDQVRSPYELLPPWIDIMDLIFSCKLKKETDTSLLVMTSLYGSSLPWYLLPWRRWHNKATISGSLRCFESGELILRKLWFLYVYKHVKFGWEMPWMELKWQLLMLFPLLPALCLDTLIATIWRWLYLISTLALIRILCVFHRGIFNGWKWQN